jgi:hypothetical protein
MRRDSPGKPRFPTVLHLFALLALSACAGVPAARGLGDGRLNVQAQRGPQILDENVLSFPQGIPARSGVVEVDPTAASASTPSPPIADASQEAEPGPAVLAAAA